MDILPQIDWVLVNNWISVVVNADHGRQLGKVGSRVFVTV